MAGAGSSEPGDNRDGTRGGFVDPNLIRTRQELAAALDELRGDLSYSDLTRSARPVGKLSSSTLNDILRSAKITKPKLSLFLIACGVQQDERPAWLDAWERTERGGARPSKAGLFSIIYSTRIQRYSPDGNTRSARSRTSSGRVLEATSSSRRYPATGRPRCLPDWSPRTHNSTFTS